MIYSSPSYALGETVEQIKAKNELRRMKTALKKWLHYRALNDAVAMGKREAKIPAAVARQRLSTQRDWELEQRIANDLYTLLAEVIDTGKLPNPDINKDPNAAVKLAQIAIAGKLPDETVSPQEQGFIWLWPAVVVVGLIAYTISSKLSADAELAAEKEKYKCIQSGGCTDYGFWLKAGGVAIVAWIVWDKLGARERLTGILAKK